MMRVLFVTGVLATLLPALAQAQTQADSVRLPVPIEEPLHIASNTSSAVSQGPLTRLPPNRRIRCCNRKGALIGAGVGAALGLWATYHLCDAGDCTPAYIGSMAILGGIGAGIGALAGNPSLRGTVMLPARRRIAVSPLVSREMQAGVVAVRF